MNKKRESCLVLGVDLTEMSGDLACQMQLCRHDKSKTDGGEMDTWNEKGGQRLVVPSGQRLLLSFMTVFGEELLAAIHTPSPEYGWRGPRSAVRSGLESSWMKQRNSGAMHEM